MNKYNAQKTEVDGYIFASKKEAARYGELKLLEKEGYIYDLELQPKFVLQEKFRDVEGKMHRAIVYIADFRYKNEAGTEIVVDTKGYKTDVFRIKEKLFLYKYPEIVFIVG